MLSLKNVKKAYDGTEILKGITLDIGNGEIVSILGPSGPDAHDHGDIHLPHADLERRKNCTRRLWRR